MAGQSADFAIALPAGLSSASAICLNLPAQATCTLSGSKLTIATTAGTVHGSWPVTVVFTVTQTTTAMAALLIPILLVPYILIRRHSGTRTVGLADFLCTAVIAATLISACGSGIPRNTPSPVPSTRTYTSSGVVTLTIH
jgi:hypothetical protein